jgi:hypothetical protein
MVLHDTPQRNSKILRPLALGTSLRMFLVSKIKKRKHDDTIEQVEA